MPDGEKTTTDIVVVPEVIITQKPRGKTREEMLEMLRSRTGAWRSGDLLTMTILECGGNMVAAAAKLKMTVKYLRWRISKNPELKARFGINAQRLLAKTEFDKAIKESKSDKTLTLLQMKIEEVVIGQANLLAWTMERLAEVRDRISNGSKARLLLRKKPELLKPDELEFVERWKFEDREEEKMLIHQEEYLLREYTHGHSVVVETNMRKAKTDQIIKNIRGKTDGGEQKPRANVAPPKGAALVATYTIPGKPLEQNGSPG